MKLWIFGHSICMPYDLENEKDGWPAILSQRLEVDYINFSQPAADNFYIYSAYFENKESIQTNDIVIVGWSHPSRKTFILDRTNPRHVSVLNHSLIYQLATVEFIRSKNNKPPHFDHWFNLLPSNTGKHFYDTWFNDYYSDYEQKINLQSYCDSVKSTCKGLYLPFFFSKNSVDGLRTNGVGFALEFINEHQVAISKDNMHPNAVGHKLWADHLYNHIKSAV